MIERAAIAELERYGFVQAKGTTRLFVSF